MGFGSAGPSLVLRVSGVCEDVRRALVRCKAFEIKIYGYRTIITVL